MSLNDLVIKDIIPSEFTRELQENDTVTQINGKPAADFLSNPRHIHDSYHYEVTRASGKSMRIDSPVPIAVDLVPSLPFLLRQIKAGDFEWEDFERFWNENEWEYLRQGLASIKSHPIIVWLFKLILRRDLNNTPELLFKGALHYHEGRKAEAHTLIEQFIDDAMEGYTTNFHAIAYYYMGLLSDDADTRADYFYYADYHNRSRLTKINQQLISEGMTPDTDDNVSLMFPTDLTLPNLHRPNVTSLKTIIHAGKHQLTPICVMPGYRANGPYQHVLETYQQMWPYFKNHINPMIVLADEYDDKSFTDYWLGGERKIYAANIPLTVMMDTDNLASNALDLTGTPTLFVINQQGDVIQQGLSEPMDYWRLLHKGAMS